VNRDVGVVCSGATSPTTDSHVLTAASDPNTIQFPIGANAADFAPKICGAGLDMNGFVSCTDAKILAIEAGDAAGTALRDYLAITCNVQ
jgi:hypothetical protein